MSRHACILGEPTGWHAARLATLLERRGFRPAIIRWRELAARITAEGDWFRPPEFAEADVVVVRGMPGTSPPEARLEEVIFRMDVLARLAADGTPVINPPRSLEIAIDKYLSLSLLAAAGLAVPQTIVVQDAAAAIEAWERLGGDCVIKPLFGSRGRGIVRGTSPEVVATAVGAGGGVSYLQEFVGHEGWDVRALVVGEQVFAMRRDAPAGEWLTNLAQGGRATAIELPAGWETLARQAAGAVGASLAGVDILPVKGGGAVVLEVNAVPGWQGMETVRGPGVAGAIADHVASLARM